MLQNLTKPQEGETAAESVQIALAASAPNGNNTLISPLHTPEGSRHGSDEPAAAGAAAMPAPAAASTAAAAEPAPRLMFKGPRWKRTAVAVHCLLFLLGCAIAGVMMWSVEKPHERKHRRRAKRREKQINNDLQAIIASFEARNDTQMADLTRELKSRVDDNCDLAVPSQYYWSYAGSLYFVATVVTTIGYGSFAPQTTAGKALTCYIAIVGIAWFAFILSILGDHLLAFVAWVDRKVRCNNVGSETTKFHIFIQALIWNGGSHGCVRYREICTQLCVCRYILFVTVVTSWWLGITFGNAAYFAVITFTTVGLGDFAPPSRPASRRRVDGVGVDAAARARRFLHHDTTYADVVGQYLLFAASSLLGLVLLALLLKALDELLQKRLSKGIDRVAAGVLAMRRRYSSDGSRRRRGRRASGGSRDDSRASSSTSA